MFAYSMLEVVNKMSRPYMKSLFLLLSIVLVFEGGTTKIQAFPKVTVQIINELSNNQDLTLHCKSKEDDLGEHTIKKEEVYSFRFRPRSFFGTTLFFCNFVWPADTSSHYFDIYDEDRDVCKACTWRIYESGPCIDNNGRGRTQCYPWNPKT